MDEATQIEHQGTTAPAKGVWYHRYARLIVTLATVAWGAIVCIGLAMLWCYAHAPGVNEASPVLWPQAGRIQRSGDRPTLILFAHPKCPCTRASIRELERLTSRVNGKVETWVVFIKPSNCGEDWMRTDLCRTAAAIPGVRVLCDDRGTESNRFRARTSGLALLYAPTGELLFEGGITSARGHEGDNDGLKSLQALVTNRRSQIRQTPVFGCPLQNPNDLAWQEPE